MEKLLYLNPRFAKTGPFKDELFIKFSKIMDAKRTFGEMWRGHHTCSCGAHSDNQDYLITVAGKTFQTNSLAAHYLRDHRHEVPQATLHMLSLAILKDPSAFLVPEQKTFSHLSPTDQELLIKGLGALLSSNTSKRIRAKERLQGIQNDANQVAQHWFKSGT